MKNNNVWQEKINEKYLHNSEMYQSWEGPALCEQIEWFLICVNIAAQQITRGCTLIYILMTHLKQNAEWKNSKHDCMVANFFHLHAK